MCAQKSICWTTGATGDGATAYTQAEVIRWQRQTFISTGNEGIAKGYLGVLIVTGTSSPVAVNTGAAYVRGFPFWNTASVNVAIPTPSGNTRIDRVVLRASWAAQTVRITRIAGTEGSGTPPALVQTDGTTWDVPLAQCSITTGGVITVTDERERLHPNIAVDGNMLDDDEVDSQHYAAGSIDLEHMSVNSVDSDQYVDGSIDLVHMSINSVDSDQYVDGSLDTVHLADDVVDDTKAGNRVPQFYRRQGGSATVWNTQGTTTYTPTAVRMQSGVIRWSGSAALIGNVTVTFPTAFSYAPQVFLQCTGSIILSLTTTYSSTTTQVTIYWACTPNTQTAIDFAWLAVGPE